MSGKNDTGVLFKNDRKVNENHPDYKGSIMVDGAEYWLAGWIKEGKTGKFLSLSVTSKPAPTSSAARPMTKVSSDDIPF